MATFPGKTSQIRDSSAQKRYREESQSQNKDSQHCAHYFSLEMAIFINNYLLNPLKTDLLKHLANHPSNFRMASQKSNLSTHKKIDKELMDTWTFIIDSLSPKELSIWHKLIWKRKRKWPFLYVRITVNSAQRPPPPLTEYKKTSLSPSEHSFRAKIQTVILSAHTERVILPSLFKWVCAIWHIPK